MKRFLIIPLLLPTLAFSQARLVFENDAYIKLENSVYLVIDNPSDNAIMGYTDGNIISEGENNVVKWNIRTNIGTYNVPWTTASNLEKIPLSIEVTSAGADPTPGDPSGLILSTYGTPANNANYPSDVKDLCSSLDLVAPVPLKVIDRFWRIDPVKYGASNNRPGVTLNFGYDFPNEGNSPNDINEMNLQAQRYNPGYTGSPSPAPGPNAGNFCNDPLGENTNIGSWQDLLFGMANVSTNRVEDVEVSQEDFYKSWTLVDNSFPLPINLSSFTVECLEEATSIQWITETETNVSHYDIYRSRDGENWVLLGQLQAAGNSTQQQFYEMQDNTEGLVYYLLYSIDFDGNVKSHGPLSSNCESTSPYWNVKPIPVTDEATITISSTEAMGEVINIYDAAGRLVKSNEIQLKKGKTTLQLDLTNLVKGTYIVRLNNGNDSYKPIRFIKF